MAVVGGIAPHHYLVLMQKTNLLDTARVRQLVIELEIRHREGLLIDSEKKELVAHTGSHYIQLAGLEVKRAALDLTDLDTISLRVHLVPVYYTFRFMPEVQHSPDEVP